METHLSGTILDEYVFFNGQRIARRSQFSQTNSAVYYFFSDHLGSSRIVTDSTGAVKEDSDFYPFGGERVVLDTLNNNYKFTGQERDSESGLDYFIARHYAFTLGRFLQSDPVTMLAQRQLDPQQINLYAYARNNPLRFIDPTGQIIDDSEATKHEEYKKWKEEYLKSEEGKKQWEKLDKDQSLTVTVKFDPEAKDSTTGDYKWDDSGKLTSATVTFGGKADDPNTTMNSSDYPFGSTLVHTNERQVYAMGHEFAHVEAANTPEGRASIQEKSERDAEFQREYKKLSPAEYLKSKEVRALHDRVMETKKKQENQADQRAKTIVESYRQR
jgi:RHS repeat-associated protein